MSPSTNPVTPPAPRPYADAPRLPEGELVDPRALLGSSTAPIELEIGPGRGGFIFERLAADPRVRILGLEVRRKWATIVDRRLASLGYAARGRVLAEDARDALPRFPSACISTAFIHFPDPWWKKRHQKRLVLAAPLVSELARILVPGGEVFVQTDVAERAGHYEGLFSLSDAFTPFLAEARRADNPFGAQSPRERRAVSDGLPIHRLHYRLKT
ncbi:MAG TPA: tRNA (guanine-N7)-methyltransferase [Polyangiaceae bacterium]